MEYWNHNTAYHPMIVGIAEGLHGDVLDVGCGEGLLVERLSRVSRQVTGVDRDEQAIRQAEQRIAAIGNASVAPGDFLTMDVTPASYDLITFVAVIHHMDLRSALRKSSALLRPGGRLIVVGLSANKSPADYMRSGAMLPLIRLLSHLHHETRRIQVVAMPPEESFSEIQTIAREELVGCRLRRALYYRYVLQWSKPLR